VDVLGHPTGRLIGERPAYEADWDEVFRRAAKAGTLLEVNANPQRLDLPADLIRRALEYGVRFIVGTDAHAPEHLGFFGVRGPHSSARLGPKQGRAQYPSPRGLFGRA
jgi:histidinol phosphatase-like PHP family hydrolase